MLEVILFSLYFLIIRVFNRVVFKVSVVLALILFWGISVFYIFQRCNSGVHFRDWLMVDSIRGLIVCLVGFIILIRFLCRDKDFFLRGKNDGFRVSLMGVGLMCFCFFIVRGFFMFYFFFEASLIPTLFLILGWGYQPERLQAGVYIIMYTVSASMPLFLVLAIV